MLVDFWATWCAPCVALLPHTVELYDCFQPRGLAVITVSLDEPEERLAVLKILVDRRAATENYLAPYGASSAAVEAFGIDGGTLPHVRLYDRQGRLARSFSGDIRADEVAGPWKICWERTEPWTSTPVCRVRETHHKRSCMVRFTHPTELLERRLPALGTKVCRV